MEKAFCRAIVAVVTTTLSVATGYAQTGGRAPAGGAVFGRSDARAASGEKLNLTVDLGESYDQNVTVRSGDAVFSPFQTSGLYTMFTPALDFAARAGEHVQLAVTGASNVRHYDQLHETIVTNHAVGAGLTANLSPKTTLFFNQGVTYAPALLYGLFGGSAAPVIGEAVPPASNYALDAERSYASATSAKLTRQVWHRATLSFESNLRYTNYIGNNPRYPDIRTRDAGGQFGYPMTRDTSLRLGYTYRQADYVGSPRNTEQNFTVGVDYSRLLSRTRKTLMAFNIGSTMANAPVVTASADLRHQYRLIGDASVTHPLGRTWSLQGSYHRGLGYIQGFQAPVFTGAYSAAANGFLNRRIDLSLAAAYSSGEAGLTGTPSQFTTYTGDARLRYAVTRMWAVYAEYLFYYYDFNEGLLLPAGLPPGLTRNGVRAGVTLWIPVRHR
jgi:hypothetical protein